MADRGALIPLEGETRFGTRTPTTATQSLFLVDSPAGKVSVLCLQDTAGDTHYLWFDTTGDLRAGTAIPTAPNSDGTIVGTQS